MFIPCKNNFIMDIGIIMKLLFYEIATTFSPFPVSVTAHVAHSPNF